MYLDEATSLEKVGKNAEAKDARHRADTVDEVVKSVASYEKRSSDAGELPSLRGFLEMVSLFTEGDDKADDQVTLMTVHGSKGLEFKHVCLVGFEDGRFPSANAEADPEQMEEERRHRGRRRHRDPLAPAGPLRRGHARYRH
jgi:DNA helicase-2/ATP-dependent DNA helicase PcrA